MSNFNNITAAILCGGLGTRLRSVVADRPKALALINGTPFIFLLLRQLSLAGLRHVVLCTGYGAEEIQSCIKDENFNLEIEFSAEPVPLGTAGALRCAIRKFRTDDLLVLNGDSFFALNLLAFCRFYLGHDVTLAIALRYIEDTSRYGRVMLGQDAVIQGFQEKGECGSGWINGGIYLLKRELLLEVKEGEKISLEEQCFPKWIKQHRTAGFTAKDALFIDIGVPESYAAAQTLLKDFYE